MWALLGTYPNFCFTRHGAKQGASGFLIAHRFNHQPDSQRETPAKFAEVHWLYHLRACSLIQFTNAVALGEDVLRLLAQAADT